ncbi:MAG: TRAM domain-containing protein, partial [Dehalococcoidia bacterium]|nr:TRAM domain-containing protein [Dehalococcoidia bacterium]
GLAICRVVVSAVRCLAAGLRRGLKTPTQTGREATNGRDNNPTDRQPLLTGRTRANKLVHWPGAASPGALVRVRITRASPWALRGERVDAAVPA